YGRAALFTLPSWVESSPVALAQALAAGVPVVTTTIGGTEHLIEDGIDGLRVPARDPAALAQALLRLLQDPATANRYAAAGRHLAAARFTQAVAAARSAEVYRMLGKVGWIGRRIGIEKYREV
ncbi:MAG: glycosyltransferase, partial [Anaerolineae bacterium]